tara:strand:- start:354 stop:584 length:231 start_codon:yes stop_codon:yes gene_type:complete
LIHVQNERRKIALDRENRFEMVLQRLVDYKEFFVSAACFGPKKFNKKGASKKLKENLKKMFPKKKRQEETVALIKS